jgi:hypothetical protein
MQTALSWDLDIIQVVFVMGFSHSDLRFIALVTARACVATKSSDLNKTMK